MTKQDYGTPREFIDAVERRFGVLVADLAAHEGNAKCEDYIDERENSLAVAWASRWPEANLWLNPPFALNTLFAAKCAVEAARRHGLILFLTPASIGTDWFAEHVNRRAIVLGLSPRIRFEGMSANPKTGKVDGYTKDLMLSVFGCGLSGFDVWRWKP